MVKMWLDDVRVPTDDWTWVKTVAEAKELLLTGTVDFASLDHDLGDACGKCWDMFHEAETGYYRRTDTCSEKGCDCACHEDGSALVRWMAETNTWPKNKPRVHSANPVGAAYMRGVIDRYGPYGA